MECKYSVGVFDGDNKVITKKYKRGNEEQFTDDTVTWMELTSEFYGILRKLGFPFNKETRKKWSALINSNKLYSPDEFDV